MGISSAFHLRFMLPEPNLVALLGAQQWIFCVHPVPRRGVRFVFRYPHSHKSSLTWLVGNHGMADICVARLIIIPLDGDFLDCRSWRIYVDVNGVEPRTLLDKPSFPKSVGNAAVLNVLSEQPVDTVHLLEFYCTGGGVQKIVDYLALSVESF